MFYEFTRLDAPRPTKVAAIFAILVYSLAITFSATLAQSPDSFPQVDDTEPLADETPLPTPTESAAAISLPNDFRVKVFAAEPEVRNPIDLAWDFQGRLWIAENYTYGQRSLRFRDDLRDRVLVFQDDDQDGTPEKRTVFLDNVSKLTSVEVGRGGVWLMCPPRLLFVPDADHDAVPDGPPQTVLDGFTVADQNYHNFANGLRFGPDGWLYGRCGGSCPGNVGPPGASESERVALEGGIWRYSVDQNRFEVVCHGTTNPWGHDFNEIGELFFINTVNGHLWHGIHGAHFMRPFTLDPNLDAYELIDQHADHYHFDTTGKWTDSRDGAANDFGGGHAHSGMMIYQADAWPAAYRGSLMTLNFHGRRANVEKLVPSGTGYVGTHQPDFFVSSDVWFRGMEMSPGPDGNVFVLDWSDLGECHEHTGVHRNSGRIFKIVHAGEGSPPFNPNEPFTAIGSAGPLELARTQLSTNRWHSHQARMRLVEMCRSGKHGEAINEAVKFLQATAANSSDVPEICRCLWTLDQIDPEFSPKDWMNHASPVVRGWAIRMMTQRWPIDDCYGPTADSRASWKDIHAEVSTWIADWETLNLDQDAALRLIVASTLQRLPGDLRSGAAERLLTISRDRDAGDHNQGKLIWYGIMSRAAEHPDEMIRVLRVSKLPDLTSLIARSLGEQIQSKPELLDEILESPIAAADADWCRAVLTGLQKGVVGLQRVPMPAAWPDFRQRAVTLDPTSAPLCEPLDKLFSDGLSPSELIGMVHDSSADIQDRLSAMVGLIENYHRDDVQPNDGPDDRAGDLIRLAKPLIGDARINLTLARSLSTIADVRVGDLLIDQYQRFRAPLRSSVVSLLCGRVEFAGVLLDAIEEKKLGKDVLSAAQVRDVIALADEALTRRIETVWGRVRETSGERLAEIDRLKDHLKPTVIAAADLSAGRVLYDRACASCHPLFGSGEKVGPDLTGAQRSSLDYLLHNIIDPDSVVGADYRAKKILTVDGRLLVGLVTQRTRRTLTLASATRIQTIPLDEIENEFDTEQSPMPSGLLTPMSDEQITNLVAYLMSPTQVELE
ncbi:PVC-type heme-binding CxxCH protein [Neorhodopirellula pilleata]|uniref:Cytochrome c n=1 Tax=Neorhodopirellula pilleata TaxID=2714738 RepID=A0A5C6AXN7_9BACT|nr:PVC-type heme-binding CxxCH protein [Neorhodopirellula pilleata]TWU03812.1 Cytochrome c [Neorhodopirellula pilleata]